MWPFYVNYSESDSKKTLRSMELFAHSTVLETLRAQGHFNKEKKRILQDLCQVLGVSPERHRAEIRRVCNDEHLNTIAEKVSGPNTVIGWATESRRLIPVMSRLGPQTVYTDIANTAARRQSAKNAMVPGPKLVTEAVEKSEDITETACTRKRKEEFHDYSIGVPRKILAMEHPSSMWSNPCLSTECFESPTPFPETPAPLDSPMVVEDAPLISAGSSFCIHSSSPSPLLTSTPNPSPIKTPFKSNPISKPTSTVTTFSSFDQMNTNLMSTSRVFQKEDKFLDSSSKRPFTTIGTVKSSTIVIPNSVAPSTMSTSTSKECGLSTSVSSTTTKFMTSHIRSKTPRQSMPAGLGMKQLSNQSTVMASKSSPVMASKSPLSSTVMTSKSPVSSTVMTSKSPVTSTVIGSKSPASSAGMVSSKSSASVMAPSTKSLTSTLKKPDTTSSSSIFAKKSTPNLFIESNNNGNNQALPQPPTTVDLKSKLNSVKVEGLHKLRSESPSPTILTQPPPNLKQMAKPPTQKASAVSSTTQGSYLSNRSLFSSGGKSSPAPPVIFNVSSSSSLSVQTDAKNSGQIILPKTTITSVAPNLAKLSTTSSTQIQYRNDGGIRSARIVNITQPGGTKLPCITPSAISALGLTTGISPIRVTVPAGSLHSNSLRGVSGSAAKPNVIVVHKAQVWPRPSSAVIMSSTPIGANNRVNNDASLGVKKDTNNHPPKPEKPSVKSLPSRTIGVRPQSPAIVTTAAIRTTDTTDDTTTTKYSDKMTEQCKMNLLKDVIEASGILLDSDSPEKSSTREKRTKSDLSNHQEVDSSRGSSVKISAASSESNSTTKPEKNGVEQGKLPFSHLKDIEVQIRDSSNTLSSALSSESISSSEYDSKCS